VARALIVLLFVAGVAGAVCVAAPVFVKTWPLTLAALAGGFAVAGVKFVLAARAALPAERRRRGLCPSCGYDLTGNASGVCPECGRAL
jgi:hypothetical protein